MNRFVWPVRVYYEDTDTAGVVYYANYLKFMERARTEWLRAIGFEQDELRLEYGMIFAVSRVEIEYHLPARFNDALLASASLERKGRASIDFHQEIMREKDGQLLCSGRIRIVCLDSQTLRPKPIPKHVMTEIADVT